jgi:hypothetical protein
MSSHYSNHRERANAEDCRISKIENWKIEWDLNVINHVAYGKTWLTEKSVDQVA